MWERGAKKYAEGGFHNNAIALCNKILRYAPGRTEMYLRLAQLFIQRGFVAEAKQKLLEYADRMKKAGRVDEAFGALKEFADLSPENEEIRLLLAEQLKAAARTDEARDQLARLYAETQSTGDARRVRVTLEKIKAVDPEYDPEKAPKPQVKARQEKSSDLVFIDLGEPSPPTGAAARTAEVEPLAIEPTSLAQEPALEAPAEAEPGAFEPQVLELEPTSLSEALPPEEELTIEPADAMFGMGEEVSGEVEAAPMDGLEPTGFEEAVESGEEAAPELPVEGGSVLGSEGLGLGVDVPELDLGRAGTLELEEPGLEVPAMEVPATEEAPLGDQGIADLPIISGAEIGPPSPSTIADLEARIADDPDNPALHHYLGEVLIEAGERERGMEELEIALGQYESLERWSEAETLADEILRLDPNSVRHHQKRVEFAFRRNDRAGLVEAYLGLADAFFRSGALDRARAVYQRVLEHDPGNERAQAALATLEPQGAAAGAGGAVERSEKPPTTGDFVDLGRLVLEDEEPAFKDPRLRIEDEQPTGDEQRDFEEMLAKFKEGIAATLSAEDAQAHYDLGIAFKEMGLLDEAIAEFQKALRGQEGRLRTSEALGVCFFEKGLYSVAATVLRRAVESDPSGDEEKIGLLYWLGRCEEELGRPAEALAYYQRVFAVDIGFQDVSQRVKSLAQGGR